MKDRVGECTPLLLRLIPQLISIRGMIKPANPRFLRLELQTRTSSRVMLEAEESVGVGLVLSEITLEVSP